MTAKSFPFAIVLALVLTALAGIVIGTYGLLVWIYQMIAGPPTG